MHRRKPLIGLLLVVDYFDLCRLEGSHVTAAAALLAPPAFPAVVADAATAAFLALAAHPLVLTDAGTAALLAVVALPPVLADLAATAVLALAAPPPVLTDAAAAALLAHTAPPPVLAEAATAAVLALAQLPPVRTGHDRQAPRALTPRVPRPAFAKFNKLVLLRKVIKGRSVCTYPRPIQTPPTAPRGPHGLPLVPCGRWLHPFDVRAALAVLS